MVFTTLITVYLRVGMYNKHQRKTSHIIISNYERNVMFNVELKRNKYFFKLILSLKPSIGK